MHNLDCRQIPFCHTGHSDSVWYWQWWEKDRALWKLIRGHLTQLGVGGRGCQGRLSEGDAWMESSRSELAQETRQRYSRKRKKPHKGTSVGKIGMKHTYSMKHTIFFLEKCNLSCDVRVKAVYVQDGNGWGGEGLMCHTNLGRRGGFFCGYFETEVPVPSHMEAQEAVSNENTDFQVTSLYEEVGTLRS